MRNVIFIVLNRTNLYIKGKKIDEKYDFGIDSYLYSKNLSENLDLIFSGLKNYRDDYEIVMLLNEVFFYSIRNNKNSDDHNEEVAGKINVCGEDIIENKPEFYVSNNSIFAWKLELLTKLVSYFADNNVKISSIFPISYFVNNDSYENIFISLQRDSAYITVVDSYGNIENFSSINQGFGSVINDLSEALNVSISYSRKILKRCGYLYIPKEYSDYCVEICYGKDMIKTVELSYICKKIRNGLTGILNKIADFKAMSDSKRVFYYCEENLNGLSNFISQFALSKASVFEYDKLHFNDLEKRYELIKCEVNKDLCNNDKNISIESNTLRKPPLINTKIKYNVFQYFEEKIHSFATSLFEE
jgi:hypothetical protein